MLTIGMAIIPVIMFDWSWKTLDDNLDQILCVIVYPKQFYNAYSKGHWE